MFTNQASGHIRTVPGSRESDDRAAHLARRRGWAKDVLRQKAKAVMAGGPLLEGAQPVQLPSVSVLVSTARPDRLERIYQTVTRQRDVQIQLVLLTRGFCPGDTYLRRLAHENGVDDVVYLYLPGDVPLGKCYNYCVRSADADVVAMMNDEDHYGPHYLSDQLYSLKYSGADVVGKQAHYLYLEQLDATLLRFDDREQRRTDFLKVQTLVGSRIGLSASPFQPINIEEASVLMHEAQGLTIYSADRFNYFQTKLGIDHRASQLPDAQLLSSGRFQFFGRPEPRIDI